MPEIKTSPDPSKRLNPQIPNLKTLTSPFNSSKIQSMILQSCKAMIKRPNNSSTNSSDEIINEDLISKLPDALLTQILSRLPDADATRTRTLSKRWKNLSPFLPNLHFVTKVFWSIEQVIKFFNAVNQTLFLRGGMPIQKLYLLFTDNCEYNHIYDLVRNIVRYQIQEIDVNFMIKVDRLRVRCCWDLFKTCRALVKLSLRGGFVLDMPKAELLFPCLKKLNLQAIALSDKSFANLVSGCPVLEELVFRRIYRDDDAQTLKVFSPSLKRFIYISTLSILSDDKVLIDAPKLEYLQILDARSSCYSLMSSPSLVEARISISNDVPEHVARLITSLASVKKLTLSHSTATALGRLHDINMPEFNIPMFDDMPLYNVPAFNMPLFLNLVKLVIRIYCTGGWDHLPVLLNNMPNLEHITFADGILPFPLPDLLDSGSWNPPEEAPACLHFSVKEIVIRNREALKEKEFTIIRYLLKHSNTLEIMTINSYQGDLKTRLQLENFYRGSSLCRIEFVNHF